MSEEATQPKKPIVLILITTLLGLALGLGGGFVLFGKSPPAAAAAGSEGGAAEEEPAQPAAEDFSARLFQLPPIVVNIEGEGYSRLLKVTVAFECESVEVRDEAEARIAQLRDGVITLVSSKRLADVTDFEGKALLKDDLRDRVNQILQSGRVVSVLLTDFVVQ